MFDLQGYIVNQSWTNRTAQQIFDELTTKTATVVDSAKYTWSGIADVVGEESTEAIRVALEANGLGWVVPQLGGAGLTLSDARVQAALGALATAGVPGCQTLKDRVVQQRSKWNSLTPDDEPTLSAVETALAGAVVAKAKLDALAVGKAAMLSRWGEFEAAISLWDGTGNAPEY